MAPGRRPRGPALDAAFRILASRPHAVRELRMKLLRKGFGRPEVEAAERRLLELGYLDDGAFARSLAGARAATRGAAYIGAELAAKGVSREVAAAATAAIDPKQQAAAARRLADARLRRMSDPGPADLARVAGMLRRRGFPEAAVRDALRRHPAFDSVQTGD